MAESDRLLDTFLSLRGRLTRLVMGIVPPREVGDIVQETYVRMCQLENKDTIREPRSFLFRTAKNLAVDHVKRAESRLTAVSDTDLHPARVTTLSKRFPAKLTYGRSRYEG